LSGPVLKDLVIGSQSMVQHPSGGVIAAHMTGMFLFYLASASANWIQLPIQMENLRLWPTVIIVPDYLVDCGT